MLSVKRKDAHTLLLNLSKNNENISVTYRVGHDQSLERNFKIKVKQIVAVPNGKTKILPSKIESSKIKHEVADDFVQGEFIDPAIKIVAKYNLFIPKKLR